MYFHKRRLLIGGAFTGSYLLLCKYATGFKSDVVRLGVAGSLANMVCECVFHVIDTINIRSKVQDSTQPQSKSTFQQVRQIYTKEGLYGFGRGFSACFYGSIFCGFSYFFLYKYVKLQLFDRFGVDANPTIVFCVASVFAETLTILVHFPYDLIKCRLQSKNYIFKYKNLPDAFKKEIRTNGFLGLYQGAFPFLVTYCSYIAIQFTIYERFMKIWRHKLGEEKFKQKEMQINFAGGLIAGSIAAGLTNPLECITVNKQTIPDFNTKQFIKQEGLWNVCTRGLIPRVAYNGAQSVLFFSLVLKIG